MALLRGWHSMSLATRMCEEMKSFAYCSAPSRSQYSTERRACLSADTMRAFGRGGAPAILCSCKARSAMWKWHTATSRSSRNSSKALSALPKCRSANSAKVSGRFDPKSLRCTGTRIERCTPTRRWANAPSLRPSPPSFKAEASSQHWIAFSHKQYCSSEKSSEEGLPAEPFAPALSAAAWSSPSATSTTLHGPSPLPAAALSPPPLGRSARRACISERFRRTRPAFEWSPESIIQRWACIRRLSASPVSVLSPRNSATLASSL
mmetsp:Transcript_62138/g.202797  ORF Transcript_62138/g.202797 Transcript_62138/m.202797 type:complete len:264 (+) Transcript_62138:2090-2881(+)